MYCYRVSYQYTNYVRQETCGGMDSEFSHTELAERTLSMVVPEESDFWRSVVLNCVREFSSNKRDKAFQVFGVESFYVDKIFSVR